MDTGFSSSSLLRVRSHSSNSLPLLTSLLFVIGVFWAECTSYCFPIIFIWNENGPTTIHDKIQDISVGVTTLVKGNEVFLLATWVITLYNCFNRHLFAENLINQIVGVLGSNIKDVICLHALDVRTLVGDGEVRTEQNPVHGTIDEEEFIHDLSELCTCN